MVTYGEGIFWVEEKEMYLSKDHTSNLKGLHLSIEIKLIIVIPQGNSFIQSKDRIRNYSVEWKR